MALINMAPMISAVMPSKLQALYGIAPGNADLMTLLQHRALLLGIIGIALAAAAHMPDLRGPVLIGGVASMGSFVVFAVARGQMSGPLGKIAMVDLAGLILAAVTAYIMFKFKG